MQSMHSGTSNNADIITSNDFESVFGWIPNNETLTRERSHSGHYSIKVDDKHEFSLGFDRELGQIDPRKLKKIKLEAWAFLPSKNASAMLGLQVMDPATGQVVMSDGIPLVEAVEADKQWVPISKEVTLVDSIAPTNHLKVFLWRNSATEPAFLDDLRITILE